MKKYIIGIMCAALAVFSACSESHLDIQNENTLSTGVFWQSEDDIESGLIAVYNMFYRQGTWTRNIYSQMQGMADDGVSYAGWTELNEWTKFKYTNYNFDEVNGKMWREHFTTIYRANQVLAHIDEVEFADESHRNDLKAQTLWLRSFYYFYMTALWDNMPLLTTVSSAADQPANSSPEEVFAQLETDLLFAIDNLPATRDAENTARPTKGAAYALLAKVYAQLHKWEDARKCLEWIIDGQGASMYDLTADYGDNFSNKKENNKESIYEIHFSLTHYVGFDQTDNYRDPNAQLGTQIEEVQSPKDIGWNNVEARRWLVDYYKRETTVTGEYDPRLYYTLWYDNVENDFPNRNHDIYGAGWKSEWGSRVWIKKYSTDVRPLYYWNDNNFRVLRLGDMLLLYAEVLNELNGPTAQAVQALNRVRNRAGLPNIENSTYYKGVTASKDTFREQIKIERALELSLECVRWIDLKRWGFDATELAKISARDADYDNFVIGKHERLPIPQREVDNNPNLNQNPNY